MTQLISKQRFLSIVISLLLCCIFSFSFSQTFTNSNLTPIPDNAAVSIPVVVSGLGNNIDTTNFGLQSVSINILHGNNQQLTLNLESPDGTIISLVRNLPGSNFSNTEFNAVSSQYIDFGNAPYSGGYRPLQDLSMLNNTQNPNGTWNLIVSDNAAGTVGSLQNVVLTFGTAPAKPLLSSSNLPIVKIYTHDQEIVDEPKIIADMYIIDNGPGAYNYPDQKNYAYAGKIGIEIRGHSSQQFPKKQFAFETREDNGIDDIDVSLLGMPKESDWILNANYADKTLMRNSLTYELSREMGQYASRTKFCEVLINDEYRGVYALQEKIKRDKNRVNVDKLDITDINAPEVTGGYIFSIDKLNGGEVTWNSKIPGSTILFQFVYPKKPEDIAPEQNSYLQNYVDSFEQSLQSPDFRDPETGFRKYVDDSSFMKFFILNELSRNIDGYRISSYFNKSRNGKIFAGPVWDFDVAWGNANFYNGNSTNGYVYMYDYPEGDFQVPFWWTKFRSDAQWNNDLINMYQNSRTSTLSTAHIYALIDSMANDLKTASQRNFTRWNILGQYVWPNPSPIPADYDGEIQSLKNFIANRFIFMDADLARVLPLQLISFTAKAEKNSVQLKWMSQNEQNTDRFEVEKSAGVPAFKKIGMVSAQNSPTENSYIFHDQDVSSGTFYYRLKQIDKDGTFSYSKIINVKIQNTGWKIYPTKVSNRLILVAPSSTIKTIQIRIFSMAGQQLSTEQVMNNGTIYKDVSNLVAGNYVLEVIDDSGNKILHRFIKE